MLIEDMGDIQRMKITARIMMVALPVIAVPALLINLGVLPFINDEAIRSQVALEMMASGDFITPTLAGDLYLKKPPVYNWFIAMCFRMTGHHDEFTLRLTAVVSLLVFLVIIYLMLRSRYGRKFAFLAALMFLTCGRILFYDSFHGLIDIAFSALVYLGLMSLFYLYKQNRIGALFLVTYGLAGLTFLMKGLPSVYFQGASLLVWFAYKRKLAKLISWQHLAGILLFMAIVGTYYWIYLARNPGTLPDILRTLYSESTQKTALGVSLVRTFRHLITFPFEFIYHFIPWTVMVLYLFSRKSWATIRKDEFLVFSLLLFAANIVVFWFSADTYGRYLFIHAAFLFPVLLTLHLEHRARRTYLYRTVFWVLLASTVLMAVAILVLPFSPQTSFVPSALPVGILLSAGILYFSYMAWRREALRLLALVSAILVFRIGFDYFILPSREKTAFGSDCRDRALEVGAAYSPDNLFIYGETEVPAQTLYYISRDWSRPIERKSVLSDEDSYIVYGPEFSESGWVRKAEIPTVLYGKRILDIVQEKESGSRIPDRP